MIRYITSLPNSPIFSLYIKVVAFVTYILEIRYRKGLRAEQLRNNLGTTSKVVAKITFCIFHLFVL